MKRVSVVIPAFNEQECLPETLRSLAQALSMIATASEIIVVDNDSQDGTRQVAEDFGVKIISESDHNISKVRNTGARNSSGDVLIFIDADTIVSEALVQKILTGMKDSRCCGGAVAVEYSGLESRWIKLYLLGWKFWGTIFHMAQGAAHFCRKSVFEELHGYDETIYMGEDIDFYWRLSKFARRNDKYVYFVQHPAVKTSARRFNKMRFWRMLLLTHPIFIRLTWRNKSYWKDWYEKAVR